MLEYAHHSRPTEKCIVRSMEQHFSEADQCIDDLHTKENKGHNSGESGAHQILINSVDFLFAIIGVPSNAVQLYYLQMCRHEPRT